MTNDRSNKLLPTDPLPTTHSPIPPCTHFLGGEKMALPLPHLDDRKFADLVEELRTQIPRYAPGWTNHNVSDPGITLLELLAWLAEMVIYRINRIPPGLYQKFRLLIGETGVPHEKAVENLWKPFRVITAADFETLAIEANPGRVARTRCLVNRNLEHTTSDETGHVSIVVVPKTGPGEKPLLGKELKDEIYSYLFSRRLITTRVHVVAPKYIDVAVHFKIKPKANYDRELVDTRVKERLREFLHPIIGGVDGRGWPFGRDVVISEIYRVIEETEGVDYTVNAELISWNREKDTKDRVYLEENCLPWYVEQSAGRTKSPLERGAPKGRGVLTSRIFA
jgi:hypothetical protein